MSVTVTIQGTPIQSAAVPYVLGMNAEHALQSAYAQPGASLAFSFALQYYGPHLGYMVIMLGGAYDVANDRYWEFFYNGQSASTGIDGTFLADGDTIAFESVPYAPARHAGTLVEVKHQTALAAAGR